MSLQSNTYDPAGNLIQRVTNNGTTTDDIRGRRGESDHVKHARPDRP